MCIYLTSLWIISDNFSGNSDRNSNLLRSRPTRTNLSTYVILNTSKKVKNSRGKKRNIRTIHSMSCSQFKNWSAFSTMKIIRCQNVTNMKIIKQYWDLSYFRSILGHCVINRISGLRNSIHFYPAMKIMKFYDMLLTISSLIIIIIRF